MRVGVIVFGIASLTAGLVNLVWHDFATGWQPIQAFSDRVPGREVYAVLTALWLIAGAVLILRPRTEALGGALLAAVYFVFAIFWLPRLYWVPHFFGFDADRIFGVLSGVGQQVILAAAGFAVWAMRSSSSRPAAVAAARWAFGLSCIAFGVNHFLGVSAVAALVPQWLPPNQSFWAILTGAGFSLAGIAILSRILDAFAARLLAAQLLIFSVLVCLPWILHDPHGHQAWGGNAYNLAAVGAAWIMAGVAARQARPHAAGPA